MSVNVWRERIKGLGAIAIGQRNGEHQGTYLWLTESDAVELVEQLGALLDPKDKMACLRCSLGGAYVQVRDERDTAKRDVQELRKRAIRLEEEREALRDRVTEMQERIDKMTKEQMQRELDAIIVAVKRAMGG